MVLNFNVYVDHNFRRTKDIKWHKIQYLDYVTTQLLIHLCFKKIEWMRLQQRNEGHERMQFMLIHATN